ncbi:Nucleotidyltransferase superfamily [Babesia duncani]|uniref:Nucleotidyltransferase superfamily n=1 Tax=Babesia duncani TaxID=323732 RepID=A0AAD9PKN8_9APIC|nr:Nucleotidyltransferase superfamily [Babesia duncani]
MDKVVEASSVDKINEITNNLTNDMLKNPYFKLPELDRTIRQLALLHPDIMSKLGVYVIPSKKVKSEQQIQPEDITEKHTRENKNVELESEYFDFIKQTEMIKAMTPEEKLVYIPKLKEAIVLEILKQRQALESLTHGLSMQGEIDAIKRFERIGIKSSVTPCIDEDSVAFSLAQKPKTRDNCQSCKNGLGQNIQNIKEALHKCVPSNYFDKGTSSPGQEFFMEHKEALLEHARRRFYLKTGSHGTDDTVHADLQDEAFGSFGQEFVIVPNKGHLWDYMSDSLARPTQRIELHHGQMPTIEQIVTILEQQRMRDIETIDFNLVNRRDQGLYCILATGTTNAHCRRVGRLLYRTLADLNVPFISKACYCYNRRSCEWIIARLGPLVVHLVTDQVKSRYSLQDFWREALEYSNTTT